MTFNDTEIQRAVTSNDLNKILTIVDSLRFGSHMTYNQIAKFFNEHCNLDMEDFDEMMYELDFI